MLHPGALAALPDHLRRALLGFGAEYLGNGVPFGGRDDVLAALDAWLADPARPYALVVAEAGRGKSAVLARWVERVSTSRCATTVFAPVSIRFGTALRTASMLLLATQLRQLAGTTGEAPRDAEAARAEIESILAEPRGDGPLRLVVLDGIDEAVGWSLERDLRLPVDPPPGLKILVSARALAGCDLDGWRRRLGWAEERTRSVTLPPLDARGVADVLRAMGDPLAALGDRAEIASVLDRVTEGDPLLLRLYVEALRAQGDAAIFLTPGDLARVPPGIDGYFDRWWAEQRKAWRGSSDRYERDARALLGTLATALGPLSRDDLDALVPGWHPEARNAALRALGRFVIGDGRAQGYVFSHPRLAYYHAERLSPAERAAWERRFVAYGESVRAGLGGGARATAYVVRHHGAHLERSGAGFRELCALVSPDWQRAWETLEGAFEGFLGDLERAWTSAEQAITERPDERPEALAAVYRCALVRASIQSLATNVSPSLLAALVASGVWSPAVALAYAGDREPTLAAIAPLLPETAVREALARLDTPGIHYMRPLALAGLLGRLIDYGHAGEVLPRLMRQAPAARARVLLELAPRLPEEVRPAAWAEIRAGAGAISEYDINGQTTVLMRLAALVPAADRKAILEEAIAAQYDDVGLEAKHLRLLALAGDFEQAMRLARDETYPYPRAYYLSHALAGARGAEQVVAFREWAAAEKALWARDDTSLRSVWPLPLPPPLLDAFLCVVRAHPRAHVRARSLVRVAQVHHVAVAEALAAVHALEEPHRFLGLLALAGELDAAERAVALAHVLARVGARRWAIPDEAWDDADIRWQLPGEGEIEWAQHPPRRAPDLLTAAARALPAEQRAPVLREALALSRAIADDAQRAQALAGLAARLSGGARDEVLARALEAARTAPQPRERARALAAIAPEYTESTRTEIVREALGAIDLDDRDLAQAMEIAATAAAALPEPERHHTLDALLGARARRRDDDWHSRALTALAPHLDEALLHAAWGAASGMEEIASLAAYGAWSPERQRPVVEAALRAIEPHVERPGHPESWLESLAPRLTAPLLREAIAMAGRLRDHMDASHRRERLLLTLLPRLAELGEGAEAIAVSKTVEDGGYRTRALCTLIPHLAAPLRASVAAEVMLQVRALPGERIADPDLATWADHLLDACAALAADGYAEELASTAQRTLSPGAAARILVKLAASMDVPDRRRPLATALALACAVPHDAVAAFAMLADHTAVLDGDDLLPLFCRALREMARRRREDVLLEKAWGTPGSIGRGLERLGGEAALLGAARACVEVAEWFP